jgi:hypothetical protein
VPVLHAWVVLGRIITCCAVTAALFAVCAASAVATATTDGRIVLVDGKPFFPLMLLNQCSDGDVSRARTLGINLLLNDACPSLAPQRQLEMAGGKPLLALAIRGQHVSGTGLVGWAYPDEPENNNWTPDALRKAVTDPTGDGLISFLTTGSGFYRAQRADVSTYAQFAQLANVAGFDLYPLGHCQRDLSVIFDAQKRFIELAGKRPTFQWIETGPIKPTYCGGFQMTATQLKAEFWLAIAGGARGIGFFTHTWTPNENAFDVTQQLQHAMQGLTQRASDLAPGLLGRTVLSGSNSSAIKIIARTAGDRTYVFAVNAQTGFVKVQFNVPALSDGTLAVYGERRSVKVTNHRFIDDFSPLAVHAYVQRR